MTVDNSRGGSDVFVKLFHVDPAKPIPIRVFFIYAAGSFTLEALPPGAYDVRYRDLETGDLYRSERFDIEERSTFDGIEYTALTLTIYKLVGGNMRTYRIDESEFE